MDQERAIRDQYGDASNLDARIALHRRFSTATTAWFPWVAERVGALAGLRVLEIGCGSGAIWRTITERGELTLSDRSPGMVATACAVATNARGVCCDVRAASFPDDAFDVVIANHMLYHVADLYGALREITRVTAPGGRFFAATNGSEHMQELEAASVEFLGMPLWRPESEPGNFWLETGGDVLPAFFPDVALHRFEDGLEVDETRPIVAYVLSTLTPEDRIRAAPALPHLESALRKRMDADGGVYRITKASGLFECRKPASGEVSVRHSSRVLLVDEDHRVFLFEGASLDGMRRFWIAPGGGRERDEDAAAAARRELQEEVGIDAELGRPVWRRVHTFRWKDGLIEQHETYFVLRVQAASVRDPAGDGYTVGHRWWTLDEIRRSECAFAPRRMARFLPPLLRGEFPSEPIDVGP